MSAQREAARVLAQMRRSRMPYTGGAGKNLTGPAGFGNEPLLESLVLSSKQARRRKRAVEEGRRLLITDEEV